MCNWLENAARHKIVVPSTTEQTRVVTEAEFAARVCDVAGVMTTLFGGATAMSATGYYETPGSVISEDVVTVTSFASTADFGAKIDKVVRHVRAWRVSWQQHSMGLEVDGDFYRI